MFGQAAQGQTGQTGQAAPGLFGSAGQNQNQQGQAGGGMFGKPATVCPVSHVCQGCHRHAGNPPCTLGTW